MFNFIKKSMAKNDKNSEKSLQSEQLFAVANQVLQDHSAGGQDNKVTAIKQYGDSVTLDLRLNADADPEEVHRQLGLALQNHGINEVNLNVSLPAKPKTSPSSHSHTTSTQAPL
nr:hypothetical protein [Psychrobacter sp. PraFG1]UNK04807.1 hypothetical protein MN210_11540 [Psychrobacter sp. PraFG1]